MKVKNIPIIIGLEEKCRKRLKRLKGVKLWES
jgi:hypothetical protein